jgi:L-lactate dehydrogenase complex protein LldE
MKVSLFITCVADQFGPQAGVSAVHLLRAAGCEVDFPMAQTCCGQPAYNAGYHDAARAVAVHLMDVFERSEYVVTPSGSCGSMLHHYAELFKTDSVQLRRAWGLAERTFELTQFLVDVLGVESTGADLSGLRIAYHDSCHAMRNLGVREQPRKLLAAAGAELVTWDEACCGFGGLFSVKMPEISSAMMDRKLDSLRAQGQVDLLTSTDLGCLMQLGGGLDRQGSGPPWAHVAQLLEPGGELAERLRGRREGGRCSGLHD